MPTFITIFGFLLICFLIVWHWDKLKKRDQERERKREINRLLDFDEAEVFK